MASSLVILVFVTCIFAVFAVHLFSGADKMNFGLAPPPPLPNPLSIHVYLFG